jgi:ABC-type dipeptide/oligopeptide/nickel transport system permease subunit
MRSGKAPHAWAPGGCCSLAAGVAVGVVAGVFAGYFGELSMRST